MNTFTLKSYTDELDLAVSSLEPEGEIKAVIQLVHGMCEHKERYYPFMEFLAANGIASVIHDHRGHGASVKSKSDYGYLYEGGWEAMVEDVRIVGDWARQRYPGKKFTLFGHSMGSMVVRSYIKRYDDTVNQLFVCGTPADNPAKGLGKCISWLYGKILGWHHLPWLMQALSFGAFNKEFKHEGYPAAWVCSDAEILKAYHSDPLCTFRFTANGFYNLMGLMADCYSKKGWKCSNTDMPVHFISGEKDPCKLSDKDFAKAVSAMVKVGYTNVSSNLYLEMRHEILNETDRQRVWDDVLGQLL